jgi:lipoprotein-anchoring transpeptidase ErfK/SrfK
VQFRLRGRIARVLRDPRRARRVRGQIRRVRPRVTHAGLARAYRTVVTVDRSGFRLRLFKRLRHDRSYPVAVGAAGTETPAGLRRVVSRQVNPAWTAPNRPWAGSYAGRTVPGGAPDNPLKARWLGLGGGVGIHGTGESFSIGSRASHGCIRMYVSDVVDLYPRVPLGTPVLIR